jgi:adenine phosphoribosyltransferase
MARKPGKLPGKVETISYDLEYGSNTIEIQKYDKD